MTRWTLVALLAAGSAAAWLVVAGGGVDSPERVGTERRRDGLASRGPEERRAEEESPARSPDTRTVFYATDRAHFRPDLGWYAMRFVWFGGVLLVGGALLLLARRWDAGWLRWTLRVACAASASVLLVRGAFQAVHMAQVAERLDVLYGGERRAADSATGLPYELGTAQVSIPPHHRRGEVERPSPWRGDFFEDPQEHMVVFEVTPTTEDSFFAAVSTTVRSSLEADAFVFVHGYNVGFEAAVLRTAQIAYDLGFQGAPILYSWPSQGRYSGYPVDETNVRWATPHLVRFLEDLKERSGARRIHLIAHSMGNRALLDALQRLREGPASGPAFNQVVLAAPDVDADTFREDIAPRILPAARQVTLYASRHDVALAASKAFHGYPRAGDAGEGVVVVEGMDTIDVSTVSSSHCYVGDNGWVLDDLGMVLLTEEPILRRPGLRFLERLRHWVLEADAP